MTKTEAEHELVLGNKQLLSVFFVVIVLLGIFFTFGYIVGKNTATAGGYNAGQAGAPGGPRPDAAGRTLETSSTPSSTPAPDSTTPANDPNSSAASSSPLPPPDRDTPGNPAVTPPQNSGSEVKTDGRVGQTPVDRSPASDTPSRTEPKTPGTEQTYLQVSAVPRADAENMVRVLKERNFPALLGESSKQGLYRVLVGPFKTTTELGHTKTQLKTMGFNPIVAK